MMSLSSDPESLYYLPECADALLDSLGLRASLPLGIAFPRLFWEEPCNCHSNGSHSNQYPIYQGPIGNIRVLIG